MSPLAVFISMPVPGNDEGSSSEKKEGTGNGGGRPKTQDSRPESKESIYLKIIERYSDLIEEHEAKSVSELKGLVAPQDGVVQEIALGIKKNYDDYSFEKDFSQAQEEAVLFVSRIGTVSLPLNFWLSFKEMLELSEADQMDKGLLLCSILRALGSADACVMLSASKEVYVKWKGGGEALLFDASTNEVNKGSEGEVMGKITGKLLYSFNDREYADFAEERISD